MEICSASEKGEVYEHIPDEVLVERLKSAEKIILKTKNFLDEIMNDINTNGKNKKYMEIRDVVEMLYVLRMSLTG